MAASLNISALGGKMNAVTRTAVVVVSMAALTTVTCRAHHETAGESGSAGSGDGSQDAPAEDGGWPSGAPACPPARSTADGVDDSPLPQIRVLYVLPSDGEDEELDENGRICAAVQSINAWFTAQTGGTAWRFDTLGGRLDLGFVRLEKSDAIMRGTGGDTIETGFAYLRDRIERELRVMSLLRPGKLYAVYYGGSSPWSCGGGAWPPRLTGVVAALYLQGEPAGARPCRSNPVGASATTPGYFEYAMLHEIVHTLGLVPEGAPNQHAAGHVYDRLAGPGLAARDLMYAQRSPADPPWATNHPAGLLLDINHDDYYAHGRPGADLAGSVFLDPQPAGSAFPPAW
jgi:hypothetical protein